MPSLNTSDDLSAFDPSDYPGGIVCAGCSTPLTRSNVMRVDITDEPDTPPWEKTQADFARVYLMACVDCVLFNRLEEVE